MRGIDDGGREETLGWILTIEKTIVMKHINTALPKVNNHQQQMDIL